MTRPRKLKEVEHKDGSFLHVKFEDGSSFLSMNKQWLFIAKGSMTALDERGSIWVKL